MSRPTLDTRGRKPGNSMFACCLVTAVCLAAPALYAADDAYLQQLDEEVTKVEAAATDTAGEGDASSAGLAVDGQQAAPVRERFETLLRQQHVGTYSFYRRLPERSREEIFLDYSNGASMETLRGKIIDRYLHP